jgi:hypothetical protein
MMAILDMTLPYVAALVTVTAAVIGFFWARGGERNQVGGVGWIAFALILVAGFVTILQTYRTNGRAAKAGIAAAEAEQRAEELSEELRRTQFTTSAALLTLVNDFDLAQPVSEGGFHFAIPLRGDKAVHPPGFTGPFPTLPPGASGTFRLWIDGVIHAQFRLTPTARGGINLRDAENRLPAVQLEGRNHDFQFLVNGQPSFTSEQPAWTAGAELPTTPDTLDPPGDGDMVYGVGIAAQGQYRRLVSQLVRQREYGRLSINMPGAAASALDAIASGYDRIESYFVFNVPTRSPGAGEACGSSYIRVPMRMRRIPAGPGRLVFALVSDLRGFRAEVCEGDS